MNVPAPEASVRIKSLGMAANALKKPVKSVKLLGYKGALKWKQESDALVISCPANMPFATSVVFKID
jgi:alpha-L-fucosidase